MNLAEPGVVNVKAEPRAGGENSDEENCGTMLYPEVVISHSELSTVKMEPGAHETDDIEVRCTEVCIEFPQNQEDSSDFSDSEQTREVNLSNDKTGNFENQSWDPVISNAVAEHGGDPMSNVTDEVLLCTECNKTFSQKGHLKRHMLTHTGLRPYACSECSFSYSQKEHLTRHMLVHAGIKPFACSYCSFSSSRKGDIMRHTFTHTGIKAFSCSCCKYSSSRKSSLQRHMLIHSERKKKPSSATSGKKNKTKIKA